jgi:hypothetical protein
MGNLDNDDGVGEVIDDSTQPACSVVNGSIGLVPEHASDLAGDLGVSIVS